MPKASYRMTPTALAQLDKVVRDTGKKWGAIQARKYLDALRAGMRDIAENHRRFNSSHRTELAEGSTFSIHLVEQRYIAFQVYDEQTIIIAGFFHENMDIPSRLRELQNMTSFEIDAIQREIVLAKVR